MSTRINGESIFDRTSDRLTDIISYINQVSRTPGPACQGLSDCFGDSIGPGIANPSMNDCERIDTMRDTLYGESTAHGNANNSLMVSNNLALNVSHEHSFTAAPQQLMTARDKEYSRKNANDQKMIFERDE